MDKNFKNKDICCDVDGVLMECYSDINKILISEFNLSPDFRIQAKAHSWGMLELPLEVRTRALELMGEPEIVENYFFRSGSKKFVKDLYDIATQNGGKLIFNTHCFNDAVADVRKNQLLVLSKAIDIHPELNISVGPKKINAPSFIIIDDYSGNLHNSDSPVKVLYSMFHNRYDKTVTNNIYRSKKYRDIVAFVEQAYKN